MWRALQLLTPTSFRESQPQTALQPLFTVDFLLHRTASKRPFHNSMQPDAGHDLQVSKYSHFNELWPLT